MKISLKLYGLDAVLVALVGILSHLCSVAMQFSDLKTASCILLPTIGLAVIGFVELIGSYRKNTQHRINQIAGILKRYYGHKISQKLALSKISDLFLKQ